MDLERRRARPSRRGRSRSRACDQGSGRGHPWLALHRRRARGPAGQRPGRTKCSLWPRRPAERDRDRRRPGRNRARWRSAHRQLRARSCSGHPEARRFRRARIGAAHSHRAGRTLVVVCRECGRRRAADCSGRRGRSSARSHRGRLRLRRFLPLPVCGRLRSQAGGAPSSGQPLRARGGHAESAHAASSAARSRYRHRLWLRPAGRPGALGRSFLAPQDDGASFRSWRQCGDHARQRSLGLRRSAARRLGARCARARAAGGAGQRVGELRASAIRSCISARRSSSPP